MGLSSGKNMGLEEGSSTDALATSWKILNWSWRGDKNTKVWQTSPWSPLKRQQPNSGVGGLILTACRFSIRITPLILTATSLWEATLTWHCKGKFSVLTWFWVKEADVSHWKKADPKLSSRGLYFTETRDSSSVAILPGAACWGGKQFVPSRWSEKHSKLKYMLACHRA